MVGRLGQLFAEEHFLVELLARAHPGKLQFDVPADLETREVALRMRKELAAIFDSLGAVHLQIGKWYEFQSQIEPAYAAALLALKRALDPNGLINPGSLGME